MNKPERLQQIVESAPPLAVAVSGGVDSMTLALFVGRARSDCIMFHAISPAVPPRATQRVRLFAKKEKWALRKIVAGEFNDNNYVSNPYDRCFYCKMNLYAEIRKNTDLLIVSGTNFDDLSDYRPGLTAADNHNVRHPFVEAGLRKSDVRSLARRIGTAELAELPASPCLSSRVETGIAIDANTLISVNTIEEWLANRFHTQTVRCRVRHDAITIEVDETCLRRLSASNRRLIRDKVLATLAQAGTETAVNLSAYRMGSAFVANAKQS